MNKGYGCLAFFVASKKRAVGEGTVLFYVVEGGGELELVEGEGLDFLYCFYGSLFYFIRRFANSLRLDDLCLIYRVAWHVGTCSHQMRYWPGIGILKGNYHI